MVDYKKYFERIYIEEIDKLEEANEYFEKRNLSLRAMIDLVKSHKAQNLSLINQAIEERNEEEVYNILNRSKDYVAEMRRVLYSSIKDFFGEDSINDLKRKYGN
ncbi:MAG: hypothetical protein COA32_10375 [Fluviicola sp.]|nr:MAG: hypothetical protein COA32_10375 [Fluviicola sp.]